MKIKIILLISFILVMLTACSESEKKTSSGVMAVVNEKQPVEAFGIVDVLEMNEISFGYPVKIEKLLVVEGQKVTGDEPLAIVDISETTELKKSREQAIASLRSESALLQNILNKRKEHLSASNDPEIIKLGKKLEYSKKEYEHFLNELAQKKELMDSGAISSKEFRDYSNQTDLQLFGMEEIELSIESLKTARQNEILQDEAALSRNMQQTSTLEQDKQALEERLNKSCIKEDKIISNITDGIVFSVDCMAGETKAPGERIFSILNMDTIIVKANVDEQFINDIRPGATAFITPESDRTREFKGKVTFISEMAVQKNGETVIPVGITPDKADSGLLPGYNVQITISVE